MSPQDAVGEDVRHSPQYHFDRHTPEYRERFQEITHEMLGQCPLAWSDTYGGHWVAAGAREVFELARSPIMSNDNDINHERKSYSGISIPKPERAQMVRGGFLEMDPPQQKYYRDALNPYLSPAAVNRWTPVVDDVVRACIDEKIESGRIDFVDDLANIVPAVMTLAMLGIPVKNWEIYCEPAHAALYTPPGSPDEPRVLELHKAMGVDLATQFFQIKENPRPGLVNALINIRVDGQPEPDIELLGTIGLLIGGGFDTTTALTAHSLEWLSDNPAERERLSRERDTLLDSATEEFLRYFTPAPGDARTISQDCVLAGKEFKEGERLWLSWAMANRDPELFERPDAIDMARKGNRHHSFGLGVHRCIGSNVARALFKRMLLAVLDRMPDYQVDPAGTMHYDTIGVIQGMRHLPATFTPGRRIGDGLEATLERVQRIVDEQRLAEPVTAQREQAKLTD